MSTTVDLDKCSKCGATDLSGGVNLHREKVHVESWCRDCHTAHKLAEFDVAQRLETRMLIDAALIRHDVEHAKSSRKAPRVREPPSVVESALRVCAALDQVDARVKLFEEQVWYNGLLTRIVEATTALASPRPLPTDVGLMTIRALETAGRVLLTLETPECDLTLIGAADPDDYLPITGRRPHIGVQGISATVSQATMMLDAATKGWASDGLNLRGSTTTRVI